MWFDSHAVEWTLFFFWQGNKIIIFCIPVFLVHFLRIITREKRRGDIIIVLVSSKLECLTIVATSLSLAMTIMEKFDRSTFNIHIFNTHILRSSSLRLNPRFWQDLFFLLLRILVYSSTGCLSIRSARQLDFFPQIRLPPRNRSINFVILSIWQRLDLNWSWTESDIYL